MWRRGVEARHKSAVHVIVRETMFMFKQRSAPPSADLSRLDFPLQAENEVRHKCSCVFRSDLRHSNDEQINVNKIEIVFFFLLSVGTLGSVSHATD